MAALPLHERLQRAVQEVCPPHTFLKRKGEILFLFVPGNFAEDICSSAPVAMEPMVPPVDVFTGTGDRKCHGDPPFLLSCWNVESTLMTWRMQTGGSNHFHQTNGFCNCFRTWMNISAKQRRKSATHWCIMGEKDSMLLPQPQSWLQQR